MRNVSRAAIAVFALGAMVVGCGQERAAPIARTSPPPKAAEATPPPAADRAQPARKKPRFHEANVYVDGEQVGVLRPLELPLSLKSRKVSLGAGYEATRWAFTDYAKSLGIDVKKIRALHLYGGSRVVVVDAAELAREGDRLRFGFLRGDRGKPRVVFPPIKLHVNSTIDLLSGVAFYVAKEPPHLVDGELVMPDGSPVGDRMPYAKSKAGIGTRMYVDGKLLGAVKRNTLTDDLLAGPPQNATKSETKSAPKDEDRVFSLSAYQSKLGVDLARARAVDLIAGDDVVARLQAAEAKKATFRAPRHGHGKILVDLPKSPRSAKITAVQVYVKSAPPPRTLASRGGQDERKAL